MSMSFEDIQHALNYVSRYGNPVPTKLKHMIMQPWQYRLLLIEGVKSGHLDYWKTWAKLYNMGYRGKDLQIK
jgi:hypothetical protein